MSMRSRAGIRLLLDGFVAACAACAIAAGATAAGAASPAPAGDAPPVLEQDAFVAKYYPPLEPAKIRVTPIGDGVALLQGVGGNMLALTGADGTVLVDDELAPLAGKVETALHGLPNGDRPLRYVIDTHYHFDHTGANAAFAALGATIVSTEALRTRLAAGGVISNGGDLRVHQPPAEAAGLPTATFDRQMTLRLDGEEILVVNFPRAHTDGDAVVFLKNAHVVHMGDIFVRYGFPLIDLRAGGSAAGMIKACRAVIDGVPDDEQVIPGHGELSSVGDLRAYVSMLEGATAAVEKARRAGKTLAQMKAQNVLAPWTERFGNPKDLSSTRAFIDVLYHSPK